jgi:hypothetical protein
VPHAPQFCGSVIRSVQIVVQSVLPPEHAHVPFWHVEPPLHTVPQPPQFQPSVIVLMQLPWQNVEPCWQRETHWLLTQ